MRDPSLSSAAKYRRYSIPDANIPTLVFRRLTEVTIGITLQILSERLILKDSTQYEAVGQSLRLTDKKCGL
ncbi:MAG: hypothetical protein U0M33_10985 [Lachnospiraceae bacterium]|nr:hypothetical protein [Lachnospiraceae bacterium]